MFIIKRINVEAGENTVILNSTDAYEMGLRSMDRIKISSKKRSITAIIELSDTILKTKEIGLPKNPLSLIKSPSVTFIGNFNSVQHFPQCEQLNFPIRITIVKSFKNFVNYIYTTK